MKKKQEICILSKHLPPKGHQLQWWLLSMSPGMWSLLSHPIRVGCPWGTHFWAWKGSDSNFTEERPGRQHLSLGSRLTPPGISSPPYCDMTRGAFNLCGCLSKIYNPCLIMRKHQTIPKWGHSIKCLTGTFQKLHGHERQGRWKRHDSRCNGGSWSGF